jgi:hypothetical protein
MLELLPAGSLRELLLPPTYGRHVTQSAEFTVLSVEIWTTGLVVNIHNASTRGVPPRITVEDHFGTKYSLQNAVTVGSRSLQVFTPTVPAGTRSLTIRATDDPDRPVVTFAVPPVRLVTEAEPATVWYPTPSQLRRPA